MAQTNYATQTIADLFDRMCSGMGECMAEPCGECPLQGFADDRENCFEAFARLLKESKNEPWEASNRGGCCSICGMRMHDGSKTCPTCGAAIV